MPAPQPPVGAGVDAVAEWASGVGLAALPLLGTARGKAVRSCLDALGRGRTAARESEALLTALAQRGEAVERADGPEPPSGEIALSLWQWFEQARLAWLCVDGPEEAVGPALEQVRGLAANLRARPTARAEEARRRHKIRDPRAAVLEYEEASERLREEALDEGRVAAARTNLADYGAWMKRGFLSPPHVRLICAALEEVEAGVCQRLVVEVPPRHGKSSLVSDLFPQWYLGRNPGRDVICATHSQEFSEGWGRGVRNALESEEFRRVFPSVRTAEDSRSATRFEVVRDGAGKRARRGVYRLFGRTSRFTGTGANLLIMDDLIAEHEADSEAAKREAHRAIQSLRSRLAPRSEGSAWVIVNTRYREDDPIGYVLREYADDGPWRVLRFPALAEEDEEHALPGGGTWGRRRGEALWPERYTAEELGVIRQTLLRTSPRDWYAQYLCRPVPASGAVVDVSLFRRYDGARAARVLGQAARIVVSVDTAKGGRARTAIGVWAEVSGRGEDDGVYLLDVLAEPIGYVEQRARVKATCDRFRPHALLIEDKSTGQALIQDLGADSDWARTPIVPVNPVADKVARMSVCTPQVPDCWIPERGSTGWVDEYEAEVTFFPYGRFADQVDMTSQFLNWRRENPVYGAASARPDPALSRAFAGAWGLGGRRVR